MRHSPLRGRFSATRSGSRRGFARAFAVFGGFALMLVSSLALARWADPTSPAAASPAPLARQPAEVDAVESALQEGIETVADRLALAGIPTAPDVPADGCAGGACVHISSRLGSVDSERGELINALVGSLLDSDIDLAVGEWNSIAAGEISLLEFIEALQADLTLSSTDQVLAADITLVQFLDAAADVAAADGDTALVDALGALEAQVAPLTGTIQLGDLLVVDLPDGALAEATLDVFDLVTGAIALYNSDHVAVTPTPIAVDGDAIGLGSIVDEVALQAMVLEPPLFVCGNGGAEFFSASIRLKLDIDLVDIGVDLGLFGGLPVELTLGDLDLYVVVGRTTGMLDSVDMMTPEVLVSAEPGIVDLYLGEIADGIFFDRTASIDPNTQLDRGVIGQLDIDSGAVVLDVEASSYAQGAAPVGPTDLVFNGPFPETQTVFTSTSFVTDVVDELLLNLDLFIDTTLLPAPVLAVIGLLLDAITDAITTELTPIVEDILIELVDPLLETLGIRIGEADVTVFGLGDPCYDLSVSKCDIPDPAEVGRPLVYAITVVNDGPQAAHNLVLTDTLPADVDFRIATSGAGTCTESGGVVVCDLGVLGKGDAVSVTIGVTPTAAVSLQNDVEVTASGLDLNPANNAYSESTAVNPASPPSAPCLDGACVHVSSRLASISSERGVLLNALLGNLLDSSVNLSVAEWNTLAGGDISLLDFLGVLESDLAVSSTDEVLEADLTIAQILDAAADVGEADGDTALVDALDALQAQATVTGTIQLGDLLQIDLPDGSLAEVSLDVLDLVTGSISLYNYDHVLVTPTPITIDGGALGPAVDAIIDEVAIQAMVLEPPIFICDSDGAEFFSAAMRLKLDVDLTDIAIDLGSLAGSTLDLTIADFELYVVVGRTTGTLDSIDLLTPEVIVTAEPGIVDLFLGEIADGIFFDRDATIDPDTDLDFGIIGSLEVDPPLLPPITVDVEARADAQGDAPSATELTFNGPFPETQSVITSATFVTDLIDELLTNLEVQIDSSVLPAALQALINTLIGLIVDAIVDTLSPILATILAEIVDPLLEVLGIRLGEADVTVFGANWTCTNLALGKCALPDPACLGRSIFYTLTAVNLGPAPAIDVVITDTLAAGTSYVSSEGASGGCSAAGPVVTCDMGDIEAGEWAVVIIETSADEVGTQADTATVAAEGIDETPGEESNNTATASPTVCDCERSVSGSVYIDTDDDGVRDIGEIGIANVDVSLYDVGPDGQQGTADDVLVATTTTDTDGRYRFGDLDFGTFYVDVEDATVPSGLDVSNGSLDPTAPVTVTSGRVEDIDIGYNGDDPATGIIGGLVWSDPDSDGLRDPGEPGIADVSLDLVSAGPDGVFGTGDDVVVDTVTTDASGRYLFPDVPPGEYIVQVTDTGGELAGASVTTGPMSPGSETSSPIRLRPGDTVPDVDFGYDRPATFEISDTLWRDLDGDGVRDPGEPGIPGVTVELRDASGDVIATATSDENGDISFPGIPDGTYIIVVTDHGQSLSGLDGTTPEAVAESRMVVVSGADAPAESFGYNQPNSLSGTVFSDADGDGVRDPGEGAIPGVSVALWRDEDANGIFDDGVDTLVGTTTTDGAGGYVFSSLQDGTYFVSVDDGQPVLVGTTPTTTDAEVGAGAPGTQLEASLAAGQSVAGLDFGYQNAALADVSGRVFDDLDRDGRDDGEPGLEGVTVALVDDEGNIVATVTTDSTGAYTFPDVPPGEYTVVVTDRDGVVDGYDLTSGLDEIPVTVGAGDVTDVDFGYNRVPATGRIGDFVWLDGDRDGSQDASESGLSGVTVELYSAGPDGVIGGGDDTLLASATTGPDGAYVFEGLPPGRYFVDVVDATVPAGLDVTTGSSDPTALIALAEGEYYDEADIGYAPAADSAIGDRVWYDADGDGIQDPGEPGIGGVDIIVTGPAYPGGTTVTTNADGSWLLTGLTPGDYTVEVDDSTLPAGYNTTPTNGELSRTLEVPSGVDVLYADFGFDGGTVGSIGDLVFFDADGDGVQDPGEPGVAGVTLNLVSAGPDMMFGTPDDFIVATAVTDADGAYDFVGLPAGDYRIDVTDIGGALTGLEPSSDTDPTATISLGPGQDYDDADLGYAPAAGSIGDLVWHDLDGDGVRDPGEPGFEGVTVDAWLDVDGDGVITPGVDNRVRSAVTDENGEYVLFGLAPGDYLIEVTDRAGVLAGFETSLGTPGEDDNGQAQPYPVTLAPGGVGDVTADFGFSAVEPRSISGITFEDIDGDGGTVPTFEPGTDRRLHEVEVRLYRDLDGDGVLGPDDPLIATVLSDSEGVYTFEDLPDGDYIVVADARNAFSNDFFQTTQQSTDSVQPVTISGADASDVDFGFHAPGGAQTVPVTLAHFRADAHGQGVAFTWSTATETGNAGFHLYAVAGDGMRRITSEIVPSQVVDSSEPQHYAIELPGPPAPAYVIEDVAVDGQVRQHGPFEIGRDHGQPIEAAAIDWAVVRAEHEREADARDARLRARLATAPGAPGGASLDAADDVTTLAASDPGRMYLRVRQTGLQRVTYEALSAAGMDLAGVLAASLAVTEDGVPVAIRVTGGPMFGPGSTIEFLGTALHTLYSDANVYQLTLDPSKALRVPSVPATPPMSAPRVPHYLETVHVEKDLTYTPSAPNGDPWIETYLVATSGPQVRTFTFETDYVVAGSAGTLTLDIWGRSELPENPDHHVLVRLNGTLVADETFDGLVAHPMRIPLPAGLLVDGANEVELTLPHDTGAAFDIVVVDAYGAEYSRRFVAADGRLDFVAGGAAFRVENLPSSSVSVWRTFGGVPERLTGLSVMPSGTGYRVEFAGKLGPFGYHVVDAGAMFAPEFALAPVPEDIESGSADSVFIAHPNFVEDLAPLEAFHVARGRSTRIVDVDQIYDRYTGGVIDAEAIAAYVRHAILEMDASAIILVGGDTYDPLDYLGLGSMSFVPSLYAKTSPDVSFAPVDPLYTDVDGDMIPDASIGRLPVRTSAELAQMIERTLDYAAKDYPRTAVFAADRADSGVSFTADSEGFIEHLPEGWSVARAYLDQTPLAAARATLIDAIDGGVALTSYVGHSAPNQWTFSGLFNIADAAALENAGRPTAVVQWGCWNTYYSSPINLGLAHHLLLSGDRGAAIVLGATTLTESSSESLLGRRIIPRLVEPGRSIGDAVRDAKLDLAAQHPELLDVILGWTILGDPTLTVDP